MSKSISNTNPILANVIESIRKGNVRLSEISLDLTISQSYLSSITKHLRMQRLIYISDWEMVNQMVRRAIYSLGDSSDVVFIPNSKRPIGANHSQISKKAFVKPAFVTKKVQSEEANKVKRMDIVAAFYGPTAMATGY